jgi:hypothetical protein
MCSRWNDYLSRGGRICGSGPNGRFDVLRIVRLIHSIVIADEGNLLITYQRTIIAQLVYSIGGSGFAGANGSMMIEVVVSLHSPHPTLIVKMSINTDCLDSTILLTICDRLTYLRT